MVHRGPQGVLKENEAWKGDGGWCEGGQSGRTSVILATTKINLAQKKKKKNKNKKMGQSRVAEVYNPLSTGRCFLVLKFFYIL